MRRTLRIAWAAVSAVLVESALLALALMPPVLLVQWIARSIGGSGGGSARAIVLLFAIGPGYVACAVCFIVLSALAMRLLGWRSPPQATLRIADMEWPLLDWARYLASTHVARVLAGVLFRATPLWTLYLRLNGASVGRGVYVNSLQVMDHNLLELGDGVVIGAGAHVSGHTVEGGFVKTGGVRLGRHVTIGLGSVIGVDVAIGADTQIGALSLVPKHSRLPERAIYAGIPVQRVDAHRERRLAFMTI